jgi:hypothetical protein
LANSAANVNVEGLEKIQQLDSTFQRRTVDLIDAGHGDKTSRKICIKLEALPCHRVDVAALGKGIKIEFDLDRSAHIC